MKTRTVMKASLGLSAALWLLAIQPLPAQEEPPGDGDLRRGPGGPGGKGQSGSTSPPWMPRGASPRPWG